MSEEATKKKAAAAPQNNKNNLMKYGFAFLFIAVVIVILLWKKEFIRISGKMPYGWDSSINYTLSDYIKTQPSRNVLILTGGYQSGKSTAFNLLADQLVGSGGSLVINADFSTVRSEKDFVGILKIACYKGLALLRQPSSYQIKQIDDIFPQTGDSDELGLISSYGKVFAALAKDLDSSENETVGIARFFDKLEKFDEIFDVCVFFHSLDNVYIFAPKYFDILFARFERRASYTDFVPVLCELKDSSLRFVFDLTDLSVQVIEMNEITNPKKDFVTKASVFRNEELVEILDAFGPHGGMIEKVFEDLKLGIPLDKSIKASERAISSSILKESSKISEEKRIALCGNSTVIDKNDLHDYKGLLSHGFIYINDEFEFKFAHKAVRSLICNQS